MAETTVTTISTKGQVVIPKNLRHELKIKASDEFLIYGERDTIILKKIAMPSLRERFLELNQRLSREMKLKGIKKKDIREAVKKVRGK